MCALAAIAASRRGIPRRHTQNSRLDFFRLSDRNRVNHVKIDLKGIKYPIVYIMSMFSESDVKTLGMQWKAKDEVILRKYTQLYNLKFELGLMGNDPYGVPYTKLRDEIARLRQDLAKSKQGSKSKLIWLTINIAPENFTDDCNYPEVQMPNLMRQIAKYANSKMFQSYIYAVEQREKTFDPSKNYVGQHVHLLLLRHHTYCHSQVARNSKNTWKYWCDTENEKVFNFHKCPQDYAQDKIDYILGKKTGDGKSDKVLIDSQWRKHHNVEKFYESEDKYFSSNYNI